MQAITAAANYLEEIFSRLHALRRLEPCQMCAAPCIGVKYQNCFGANDEHRGFVKWEHNYIQTVVKRCFASD
jgi:tRNA(Arg) A34 adenosine deaminase TadA